MIFLNLYQNHSILENIYVKINYKTIFKSLTNGGIVLYLGLSEKQVEILEYIKYEIETNGYSPSIRKIGGKVNLKSPASVHQHLITLQKKGYLLRDPGTPRSISIIEKKPKDESSFINDVVNLPVISDFSNTEDIFDAKNISEYLVTPKIMSWGECDFIYIKNGANMKNFGILHNDSVVINTTSPAKNRDLVLVSFLTDIIDIRQYCITKDGIVLKSVNDLNVEGKPYKILGVVTGILRTIT